MIIYNNIYNIYIYASRKNEYLVRLFAEIVLYNRIY